MACVEGPNSKISPPLLFDRRGLPIIPNCITRHGSDSVASPRVGNHPATIEKYKQRVSTAFLKHCPLESMSPLLPPHNTTHGRSTARCIFVCSENRRRTSEGLRVPHTPHMRAQRRNECRSHWIIARQPNIPCVDVHPKLPILDISGDFAWISPYQTRTSDGPDSRQIRCQRKSPCRRSSARKEY